MKKTTMPKKKMAAGGINKKSLPKAQDGKFQQVNAINPNYKMDSSGAMFPKMAKSDYTSNNKNLLGRNVSTEYDVGIGKGTITKTVTNRKGEVVRQSQPRVLNSKKVERKMTRQMGRDASTDPSESSGSFARKGAIVKKKMAKGGSASSALKTFNDNKAIAYKKAGGAMAAYKKTLKKAQTGLGTPFQEYMKTPGAVASDTVMKTVSPDMPELQGGPGYWNAAKRPVAKNPNNQNLLEKVYEQTYGQGWRGDTGQPARGETFEQYKRRMGPLKKGGSTMAKGGATKAKKFAALAPPYNKATAADRIAGAKKKKK